MRRVPQLFGLTGFLMTGFLSTHALAEETPSADAEPSAGEPKTEQPTPVAPAAPVVAVAEPVAAPAARPKVGDMSSHGYFRGGFGASVEQKGRAVCFGLSSINGSLKSKYRLGNECEQWGELLLSTVVYAGDDGVVGTFHFRPVVFIPTTYIGYSPAMSTSLQDQPGEPSTGATVAFPDLYADLKGIGWLFGGKAWAGSRYYKRESVYISDFFYWNPSGVGLGIEDAFQLGKIWSDAPDALKDLSFCYGAFAMDGQPKAASAGSPTLPQRYAFGLRNDLQLRGFRPWLGAELQLGFQYILDLSNDQDDSGNAAVTNGGWGVTFQYVQEVLGGNNKFVIQYGKGGGTGFGTLARFYYPDFSLHQDLSESRFRFVDVLTIQPLDRLGAQLVAVYQHDDNKTPSAGDWISVGGRVSVGIFKNFKALGEVGQDTVTPKNNSGARTLTKFSGALAFAPAMGFWARPEIRVFYTMARWNENARTAGVDSANFYRTTEYLSGSLVGVQAEAMW